MASGAFPGEGDSYGPADSAGVAGDTAVPILKRRGCTAPFVIEPAERHVFFRGGYGLKVGVSGEVFR